MTIQELAEELGLSTIDAEYGVIVDTFLNGELLEDVFCEDYIEHRGSAIIKGYYKRCKVYDETIECVNKQLVSAGTLAMATAEMLIRKADEHMDEELYDTAINLIGIEACLEYKLNRDLELNKHDKEYILNVLKG